MGIGDQPAGERQRSALGAYLAEWRASLGDSREEAADMLDMSYDELATIERDGGPLPDGPAAFLARVAGVYIAPNEAVAIQHMRGFVEALIADWNAQGQQPPIPERSEDQA